MRVVIVGAGAMGALYGSFFHQAGEEVWFLEINPAAVAAIERDGLVITRRDDTVDRFKVRAVGNADDLPGIADLVLFQVKGFATEAAARAVAPAVGPDTILMTLQNGLGNEQKIRSVFPDGRILIGMSVHTCAQTGPGQYYHSGTRETLLGPAGPDLFQDATRIAETLRRSGYAAEALEEDAIRKEVYAKWVLNCGSLPVLSVTGLPTDRINGREDVLVLCDAITREACELAALEGYPLDADERVAYNRSLFTTAGGKASMLSDIEALRKTEIDSINGAAILIADRHGHPAPYNRAMVSMVKGREIALGIVP